MSEHENKMEKLALALQYLAQGFSIIPLPAGSKIPAKGFEWGEFMKRCATEEEVRGWLEANPDTNLAVVTGSISKLVIVDVDIGPEKQGDESAKQLHLPPTYFVKTGGGGWHFCYRWPHDRPAPNFKSYLPGIDIQGNGAYAVMPLSIHPNGNTYEAANDMDEMTDAPDWLVALGSSDQPQEKLWKKNKDGAKEGERNVTAASYCGKILSELDPEVWETAGWGALKEWNGKNTKPLPEKELRKTFESIAKREVKQHDDDGDGGKASVAKRIVSMVQATKPVLVHDLFSVPFARIEVDHHTELQAIHSQRFRQWVTRLYYTQTKRPPQSESIKQALNVLASLALFEGKQVCLANRVAEHDGAFWYDLCDSMWQAIKVNETGWKLVEQPPIIFYRQKHQKIQVLPAGGGTLSQLLDFVNIADEEQRLLFQIYLISCFVPNIPHPIPVLFGSQGSAKSTFMRIIRRLIDPSAIELLTFPTRKEELVQQLSHHWAPMYDNVTTVPEWLSDALCRCVTGEGFSKRELYTDDEDVIYSFRCCIGLNGINIAATKADLLDRSILFGLERIRPENRRDEQAFWKAFEEARPSILGAIFDALVRAVALQPTIKLNQLPRMADFALWGSAIAQAIGSTQEAFLKSYQNNIERQNEEAIQEHPVAVALMSFLEERGQWSGSCTMLLSELNTVAESQKIDIKQQLWPKAPSAMTRRLNEIKTNMENAGVLISMGTKNHSRTITISKCQSATETAASDSNDGISGEITQGEMSL